MQNKLTAQQIPAILAAVGGEWSIRPPDPGESYSEMHGKATRADRFTLYFRFGGYQLAGRLEVAANYSSEIPELFNYGLRDHMKWSERQQLKTSITLADTKTPAQAGNEIAKRLMAPLAEAIQAAIAADARYLQEEADAEAWRARMLEASNGHLTNQPHSAKKRDMSLYSLNAYGGRLDVHVDAYHGRGANIKIEDIPEDTLTAILRILYPEPMPAALPEAEAQEKDMELAQ